MSDEADTRPSNKVARLIGEYDLEEMGEYLEDRWTAEGNERMSLRDLAKHFNERLVERKLREAGLSALATDVERTYKQLTDEDVSAGVQTDVRMRLGQHGIDVENLEEDFVTYQAIRSFLTEYRDAEYDHPSDAEKVSADREAIQRLVGRTVSVTEDRIESLRESGRLDLAKFEVLLDLRVLCHDCGAQYRFGELLERGGCDCQHES